MNCTLISAILSHSIIEIGYSALLVPLHLYIFFIPSKFNKKQLIFEDLNYNYQAIVTNIDYLIPEEIYPFQQKNVYNF